MFTQLFSRLIGTVDCCPWVGHAYGLQAKPVPKKLPRPFLYSPAERRRRDASPWTKVQGILAPIQFLVFLISLSCVVHYLLTGIGLGLATASILVKTLLLLTIMVTGAIWEKDVYGQYLLAPAFFWEDVVSFLVIALHLTYVAVLLAGLATPHVQMLIALAAYASYLVNAGQFMMKMVGARREQSRAPVGLAQ